MDTMNRERAVCYTWKGAYGFLRTPNGQSIFVHHSNIVMSGYRQLAEGDEVTFTRATDEHGKTYAVDVVRAAADAPAHPDPWGDSE